MASPICQSARIPVQQPPPARTLTHFPDIRFAKKRLNTNSLAIAGKAHIDAELPVGKERLNTNSLAIAGKAHIDAELPVGKERLNTNSQNSQKSQKVGFMWQLDCGLGYTCVAPNARHNAGVTRHAGRWRKIQLTSSRRWIALWLNMRGLSTKA